MVRCAREVDWDCFRIAQVVAKQLVSISDHALTNGRGSEDMVTAWTEMLV